MVASTEAVAAKAAATAGNQANKRAVRALVITARDESVSKSAAGDGGGAESKALSQDAFHNLAASGRIIDPPFDLFTLSTLIEQNSELGPCIEAMEINIEGYGHTLSSRVDVDAKDVPDDLKLAVRSEKVRLDNFFTYASMDDSFIMLRRKLRKDIEATGNAYLEVLRSANGKIQGFCHIPSYQMRLGKMDDELVDTKATIHQLMPDNSVELKEVPVPRRFRTYCQGKIVSSATAGGKDARSRSARWFKAFGDPRALDCETGKFGSDVPPERRATEVVHFRLYSTRSPYGLPRYIGNLLAIFGDRAAEQINYHTFKNNNIPSMAILVSDGQLTTESIKRIEDLAASQIQGSDNYSKFVIIEAETLGEEDGETTGAGGHPKIAIEKLQDQQHKDALFTTYSEKAQERIRRSWRLPPILVGKSEDYTRSTADTSRRLADEQVFAPERNEFDSWINRILFPAMGVIYHRFKTNSPNTTDNAELVKILGGAEKTGGMTPHIARIVLQDILGIELPPFPEDFDQHRPFSLAMAEAVKNKAEAAEPGQQVTALKRLMGAGDPDPDDVFTTLFAFRDLVEGKWQQMVADAEHSLA